MDKLKSSADNREARLLFVDYWAEFVRTHSDQEWGSQQASFINALMKNAGHYPFSAQKYLEMKGERIALSRSVQHP